MNKATSFQPEVDKLRLDDLRQRLDRACNEARSRPNPVAVFESDKERFGITHERYLQLLIAWQNFLREDRKSEHDDRIGPEYDSWPAFEKKLKSFQHSKIAIEDIDLHFIHEKGTSTNNRPTIPLLLLHGWPSSVLDFFKVIKPLAHPESEDVSAFDVVVPSHTGYLWSSSPKADELGIGKHGGPQGDFLVEDEARIMHKLMLSLGYRRYAIQAGDWGASVARYMAKFYPHNVVALHLNICPAPPPLLNPPLLGYISKLIPSHIFSVASALVPKAISSFIKLIREYPRWMPRTRYLNQPGIISIIAHILFGFPAPLSMKEIEGMQRGLHFAATGGAYALMHATRPFTIGLITQSDPCALLAWVGEKLLQWTDEDPSDAEICAVLTLYWCTDTLPRSIYNYRNRPPGGPETVAGDPTYFIKQPMGLSDFPKEIASFPISWIKKTANLQWYKQHSSGGHFASLEKPKEYINDVRDCFAKIWPD